MDYSYNPMLALAVMVTDHPGEYKKKHNAHLIPVPAEEPVAETPVPEEVTEETKEEPVEEPVEEPPAPKKTSRKKAAATVEAEA